jgi:hypothetical protein
MPVTMKILPNRSVATIENRNPLASFHQRAGGSETNRKDHALARQAAAVTGNVTVASSYG